MYISTLLLIACLALSASAALVNNFGVAETDLQLTPAKAQYLLRPLYPGRWCLRCYPVGCWSSHWNWPFCRWYPWPWWHNSIVCRWQWCPIWRPTPTFIPIPTLPKIPEPDPVIRFHPEFDLPRLAGHLAIREVVAKGRDAEAPQGVATRDVDVKGSAQTTVVFSNSGEFPGVRVARVRVGDDETDAAGLGLGFGFRVLGFIEFQDKGTNAGFDTEDDQVRVVLFSSLGNWTAIELREINDGGVAVTGESQLRNAAGEVFASVVVKFTDNVDGKTRGAEEERAGPERVKFTLRLVKPHSVAGSSIAILGEVRHRSRVDDNSRDSEAGLSALLVQPDAGSDDARPGFVSWDTTVLADGSVRTLTAQAHGNTLPAKLETPPIDGFTGSLEHAVFLTFSVQTSDNQPSEIVWDPAVGAVSDQRDPGPTAPTPSPKPGKIDLGPSRYVPAIIPAAGRFRLWPLYPGRWCLRCYRIGCWWRWWSWPFCRRWPFPFGWNTIYCRWVWCPIFFPKPSLPIETAIPKPGDDVINPVFDLPRFGGHFAATVAGRSVLEGQMEMRELAGEQSSLVVFSTGENFPTFRVARVNPNSNGEAQGAGLGFGFRLLGFVEYVDQNEEGLDSADPITRTVYFNNVGANWTDIDVAVLGDSANYTVKSTLGAGPLAEVQVLFTDAFNDFGGDVSGPERAKFVLTLRNAFSTAGTRISVIGQIAHSSFVNDDSVGGELNAVTIAPDEAAQSSQRSGFISWQNNVLGDGSVVRLIPKSWGVIPPTGVAAPGDGFAQSETLVYLSFSLAGTAQPAVISWDPTTGVVADTQNGGPTPAPTNNAQAEVSPNPNNPNGFATQSSQGLTPAQIGGIVGGVVGFLILLLILLCIIACIKKILCCAARSVTGKPKRMSSSTMYDAPTAAAAAPGSSFQDSAGGYAPAYSGSGGYGGTSGGYDGTSGGYGSAGSGSDGAAATSGGYAAATSGGAAASGGGYSGGGSASGGGTLSGSGYGSEGV